MPIEKTIDDMFVITISSKEEYEKLKEVCKKRDISYPNNFFKDDYQNHIYGVTPYSIGYVGTSIAMHVKEDHIVHTVDELVKKLDSYINKLKPHFTFHMPDGTLLSVSPNEGETIEELSKRVMEGYYDSIGQLPPFDPNIEVGNCPICKGKLVTRVTKHGIVVHCNKYPRCEYLRPITKEELKIYEYKIFYRQLYETLISRVGYKEAKRLIELYDDEIEDLCKLFEGSVGGVATAMVMGY